MSQLILCINRNSLDYQKFGRDIVTDSNQDFEGPLAGMIAAIEHIESNDHFDAIDQLVVSSCDSPNLPSNYVESLNAALDETRCSSALVFDGKRNQNLHTLIKRVAWPSLIEFYADGGRAMHRWHAKNQSLAVDFSEQAECFVNINTPEQLLHKS